MAVFEAGRIGPEAREAVPALIELLMGEDKEYMRQAAARSLGRIGPDARAAMPALTKALEVEEFDVGRVIAEALQKIRQE